MWVILVAALVWSAVRAVRGRIDTQLNLAIPAAWILGAAWIWHSKPESWFSCYLHFAAWTFCGLAMLDAWRLRQFRWLANVVGLMLALSALFLYVDVSQMARLASDASWRWGTFGSYVDCIDRRLALLRNDLAIERPLRVWVPMYPDVTVELSRRHPGWSYTRHNDFRERKELALRHGRDVDAVVLTEVRPGEGGGNREGPLNGFQDIRSAWIGERGQMRDPQRPEYVLHELGAEPGWKPERFYCERGRWQAFLFMNASRR